MYTKAEKILRSMPDMEVGMTLQNKPSLVVREGEVTPAAAASLDVGFRWNMQQFSGKCWSKVRRQAVRMTTLMFLNGALGGRYYLNKDKVWDVTLN